MAELSEALQALVDARLDTIDRMLMGRVPRGDRLAIVREVESQVHDQLDRIEADSVDREAVLAVLARLDPPEAYLPEAEAGEPAAPRAATPPRRVAAPAPEPSRRVGVAGGVLGLIAMAMVGLGALIFIAAEFGIFGNIGEGILIPVFMAFGLGLISGTLGVILACYARLGSAWAIAGLATGLIAGFGAITGATWLIYLVI